MKKARERVQRGENISIIRMDDNEKLDKDMARVRSLLSRQRCILKGGFQKHRKTKEKATVIVCRRCKLWVCGRKISLLLDKGLGNSWRAHVWNMPVSAHINETEEHRLAENALREFKDELVFTTCLTMGKFASNGYTKWGGKIIKCTACRKQTCGAEISQWSDSQLGTKWSVTGKN